VIAHSQGDGSVCVDVCRRPASTISRKRIFGTRFKSQRRLPSDRSVRRGFRARCTVRTSTVCRNEITEGLPLWPNRDPIGEKAGINLYAIAANDPLSKVDVDGRLCLCRSLKFWWRDGAPIFAWDVMDIGEDVEQRNGVNPGTGRVRHCVAACLLKRHFGGILGWNMRDAWDYFHEDPTSEDSRRDMQAEDVGEGFACSADETCEAACLRHFGRNPR
jgi:hypothetical protein